MDKGFRGMYLSIDRSRTHYSSIVEFVESNGLDEMFEDMYGRPIKDYIDIFGLQYHNGAIANEIILGFCEEGLQEPRKIKVGPDYSLEIHW